MGVLRIRASASWMAAIISLCGSAGIAIAGGATFDDRFDSIDSSVAGPPTYSPLAVPAKAGLVGFLYSNAYAAGQNPKDLAALGVRAASSAVRNYLVPALGANAPDWVKRIEFEFDVQKNLKPTYSILTVQPLYQSSNKQDTVFVQASQLRYDLLDKYRDTSNIGFGYRRLLFEKSLLLGVNTFFDKEWTYGHARYSIGGEAKWAMLDFNANLYRAATGYKMIDAANGTEERAMGGYDFELRSQVPYLPWMSAGVRRYHWDSDLNNDLNGWVYSAAADLTPNFSLEAGYSRGNGQSGEGFVKLAFHLARTDRPAMVSSEPISHVMFERRDLRTYTLDKVRRENKIIVERRTIVGSATVVIARGN